MRQGSSGQGMAKNGSKRRRAALHRPEPEPDAAAAECEQGAADGKDATERVTATHVDPFEKAVTEVTEAVARACAALVRLASRVEPIEANAARSAAGAPGFLGVPADFPVGNVLQSVRAWEARLTAPSEPSPPPVAADRESCGGSEQGSACEYFFMDAMDIEGEGDAEASLDQQSEGEGDAETSIEELRGETVATAERRIEDEVPPELRSEGTAYDASALSKGLAATISEDESAISSHEQATKESEIQATKELDEKYETEEHPSEREAIDEPTPESVKHGIIVLPSDDEAILKLRSEAEAIVERRSEDLADLRAAAGDTACGDADASSGGGDHQLDAAREAADCGAKWGDLSTESSDDEHRGTAPPRADAAELSAGPADDGWSVPEAPEAPVASKPNGSNAAASRKERRRLARLAKRPARRPAKLANTVRQRELHQAQLGTASDELAELRAEEAASELELRCDALDAESAGAKTSREKLHPDETAKLRAVKAAAVRAAEAKLVRAAEAWADADFGPLELNDGGTDGEPLELAIGAEPEAKMSREHLQVAFFEQAALAAAATRELEEASADSAICGRLERVARLHRYCDLAQVLLRFRDEVSGLEDVADSIEARAAPTLPEKAMDSLLTKVEACFAADCGNSLDERVELVSTYVQKSIRVSAGLRT